MHIRSGRHISAQLEGNWSNWAPHRKKEREREINTLHANIARLEAQHKISLRQNCLAELTRTRKELLARLNLKLKRKINRWKSIFYETNNKSGKFLARVLRAARTNMNINNICTREGKTVHAPADIADQFRKYYETLYNLEPQPGSKQLEERMDTYLKASRLPTLPPEITSQLSSPISRTEVEKAISQMNPNKPPGPDGLTPLYCRTFADNLIPHFVDPFNNSNSNTTPRSHTRSAYYGNS